MGLVLMGLLLAASIGVRIEGYRQPPAGVTAARDAPGNPVDLGDGVLLPRAAARPLAVPVESCATPASVLFVQASPYGSDPALIGAPRPGDRVAYLYRGWNLGSRFIALGINGIYFARLAYARLTTRTRPAADDVVVKIVIPARCGTSPETVMARLRQLARPSSPPG